MWGTCFSRLDSWFLPTFKPLGIQQNSSPTRCLLISWNTIQVKNLAAMTNHCGIRTRPSTMSTDNQGRSAN